jgi:hypothetical protein
LRERLAEIQNPNFESEALPETSVKVESVNRTVGPFSIVKKQLINAQLEVINDLIHLSCVLAFPGMCGSTAFPTLYFNFQGIGSNLQNTEVCCKLAPESPRLRKPDISSSTCRYVFRRVKEMR